jgi:protease I
MPEKRKSSNVWRGARAYRWLPFAVDDSLDGAARRARKRWEAGEKSRQMEKIYEESKTTMDKPLEGYRVAILAINGFEEAELVEPRKALESAGAKTTVVAPDGSAVQGMNHSEKGQQVKVDRKLSDAKPDDFDAVLLPGGVVNADNLRMNSDAQQFVKALDAAKKPVAVICHGPWLLISAGLTKGRHLTSYHTLQDDVRNAGAKWSDEEVVRDANWVSSRKPDDIPAFNREMVRLFSDSSQRPKVQKRATSGR